MKRNHDSVNTNVRNTTSTTTTMITLAETRGHKEVAVTFKGPVALINAGNISGRFYLRKHVPSPIYRHIMGLGTQVHDLIDSFTGDMMPLSLVIDCSDSIMLDFHGEVRLQVGDAAARPRTFDCE
jgi:N-methylhydantoinase A/oxoprolinase/acetone carboxylase beta subunit